MRSLRVLTPVRAIDARYVSANVRTRRAAFTIALFAVILSLALSGNTLEVLGIDYSSPGGNPLVKLLPSTYLVTIAAGMILFLQRPAGIGVVRLFREKPALAGFLALMTFCTFYSILVVGMTGAATYIESFISAGLLAIAIEGGTDRQKRTLAWWIVGFIVLSILLSIYESITQTHIIPPIYGDEVDTTKQIQDIEDFRGAGLFGHPLTAALTTSMATFMLLRMRMNPLLKGALFTFFIVGLLNFGGRAALGVTVVFIVVAAFVALVRGVVRRDLSLSFVGTILAALLVLPPLVILLLTSTDIGSRLVAHMYLDDSADVRSMQWMVLKYLNMNDVLFGVNMARLASLKYQIGLGGAQTDIENFWLLIFLNLGIVGFAVFLIGLGLLIAHLGRTTKGPLGWMLLVSAIIIDSTSNSLGRKSADLFFMVACMVAMTGYPRVAARTIRLARPRPPLAVQRAAQRLTARPSQAKLAGYKS